MSTQSSAVSTFVVGAFGAVAGLGLGALLWASGGSANEPAWGVDTPAVADEALLAELRELTRLLRDERAGPSLGSASRARAGADAPTTADIEPLDLSALEQVERVSTAFGAHVDRLAELLAASPAAPLSQVREPAPEQIVALKTELTGLYQATEAEQRSRTEEWFGSSAAEVRARLGVPDDVRHWQEKLVWEYRIDVQGQRVRIAVQFVDGYVVNVVAY